MSQAAQAGQQTVARVLRARWKAAHNAYQENGTDRNSDEERRRWDELIDYIEAHDLDGTEVDPR